MPYVPPHLRGQGSSGGASNKQPTDAGGLVGGRDGGRPPAGGGSREPADGGGIPRSGSNADLPRNASQASLGGSAMNRSGSRSSMHDGAGGRRGGRSEAVIGAWTPSERVTALSAEQIADIRQRLNVTVVVGPDQPPAMPPIESFQDMVCVAGVMRLYWRGGGRVIEPVLISAQSRISSRPGQHLVAAVDLGMRLQVGQRWHRMRGIRRTLCLCESAGLEEGWEGL
eukprot:365674-Chlamydomonas_euryale.AAC.3